jgi:hypothetical protein
MVLRSLVCSKFMSVADPRSNRQPTSNDMERGQDESAKGLVKVRFELQEREVVGPTNIETMWADSKGLTRALYARIMNASLASIMPQVIGVWCKEEGHDVTFVCYTVMPKRHVDKRLQSVSGLLIRSLASPCRRSARIRQLLGFPSALPWAALIAREGIGSTPKLLLFASLAAPKRSFVYPLRRFAAPLLPFSTCRVFTVGHRARRGFGVYLGQAMSVRLLMGCG